MVETLAGEHGPSMTLDEQRTHVSLWAMMAAPLLAGNDIRTMSGQTRELLINPDIIAVDQDRLVRQGRPSPGTGGSWSSRWPGRGRDLDDQPGFTARNDCHHRSRRGPAPHPVLPGSRSVDPRRQQHPE